jgi:hypothetical protein
MEQEKFYTLINKPACPDQKTVEELKAVTETYPYFQAAWMLYLKWLKTTGDPQFEQVLKTAAPRVPDRKKLYHLLHPKGDSLTPTDVLNQLDPNHVETVLGTDKNQSPEHHLINKFLSTRPRPVKLEKTAPEKQNTNANNELIVKAVTESDDLVTETLAMIFKKQKKYDKAVEAFQKLSLKYPEKSVYFANQIKEIEKLKNI